MLEAEQQLLVNTVANRLTEEEMETLQWVCEHLQHNYDDAWSKCEDKDGSLKAVVQNAIGAAMRDKQLAQSQVQSQVSEIVDLFFCCGAKNIATLLSEVSESAVVLSSCERYRQADAAASYLVTVRNNALEQVNDVGGKIRKKSFVK